MTVSVVAPVSRPFEDDAEIAVQHGVHLGPFSLGVSTMRSISP